MKLTLSDRLTNYLRKQQGYVASGELQKLAMNAGYTPQTAGRKLRLLAEDGVLEVEYREKRHAFYRYKPQKKTVSRIVVEKGVAKEIISEVSE